MFREESKRDDEEDIESSEAGVKTTSFYDHWGWVVSIDLVSGNNPLKWDKVTEMKAVEFLNILSYLKDKRAMEDEISRG